MSVETETQRAAEVADVIERTGANPGLFEQMEEPPTEPAPISTPTTDEAADSERNRDADAVGQTASTVSSLARVPVNRNKTITAEIEVLGDVHLGKRFTNNVPLDRRGEREATVWQDFEASLMGATAKYHVQVGDLFDAMIVPIEVVLRTADIYIAASNANQSTRYVVYCGNHDRSRDANRRSSFDLFRRLVGECWNISVLTEVEAMTNGEGIAVLPWHPFKTAAELASELDGSNYDVVFGHWDCKSFGGDDHNLIPLDQLAGKTKLIVTGHEHTPREFEHGDMRIVVVGSMQPYSHAEDAEGEFYLTLTPTEYDERIQEEDLSDRNLRFVLTEGEVAPTVPALSVTTKTVTTENEEVAIEVDFDNFNINELLAASLDEAGVNETYTAKVTEKFGELRAEV